MNHIRTNVHAECDFEAEGFLPFPGLENGDSGARFSRVPESYRIDEASGQKEKLVSGAKPAIKASISVPK